MKKSLQNIINYYQKTAPGAYERWGGTTGSYHYGYYKDPNIDVSGKQPEDVQKLHHKSHLDMLKLITNFVNPKPGEVIIDAGCGVGSMFPSLSKAGAKVIGVNITPLHITKAKERIKKLDLKNVKLLQCDYAKIPIASASVDKIMFLESLIHATNKKQVIKEADRLLKPGGEIFFIESILTKDKTKYIKITQKKINELEKGGCAKTMSYALLDSMLKSLGYSTKIKDITLHVLPSMQLAAVSAEAHKSEAAPKDVVYHRLATTNNRDLHQVEAFHQYMLNATKPS